MSERKSFAFRRMELDDNKHVPLNRQMARNDWDARKNKTPNPLRPQVEVNAGKAQKNMPDNYILQKKEW